MRWELEVLQNSVNQGSHEVVKMLTIVREYGSKPGKTLRPCQSQLMPLG